MVIPTNKTKKRKAKVLKFRPKKNIQKPKTTAGKQTTTGNSSEDNNRKLVENDDSENNTDNEGHLVRSAQKVAKKKEEMLPDAETTVEPAVLLSEEDEDQKEILDSSKLAVKRMVVAGSSLMEKSTTIQLQIIPSGASQEAIGNGKKDTSIAIPPAEEGEVTLMSFCRKFKIKKSKENEQENEEIKAQKPTIISTKSKNNKLQSTSTSSAAQNMNNSSSGPMVELVNGEIVIRESSIQVGGQISTREVDEELGEEVHEDHDGLFTSTYSSYKTKPNMKSKRWDVADTELFYSALRQCGTDFTMMMAFFPGLSRKQLKTKFQKELEINSRLITMSLHPRARIPFKPPTPEVVTAEEEEEGEENEDEEGTATDDDPSKCRLPKAQSYQNRIKSPVRMKDDSDSDSDSDGDEVDSTKSFTEDEDDKVDIDAVVREHGVEV